MIRYIIGNHPEGKKYGFGLDVPVGGVNYTHARQAVELLRSTMDIISLTQCEAQVMSAIARRAGIAPPLLTHANHNAHGDQDTRAVETHMRMAWDRYVFEQAVRLPSFMDCQGQASQS